MREQWAVGDVAWLLVDRAFRYKPYGLTWRRSYPVVSVLAAVLVLNVDGEAFPVAADEASHLDHFAQRAAQRRAERRALAMVHATR